MDFDCAVFSIYSSEKLGGSSQNAVQGHFKSKQSNCFSKKCLVPKQINIEWNYLFVKFIS